MPKVPENEWKKFSIPESEEYAPTTREVEDERRMKESVNYELSDIDRELVHPTEDPHTGEKSKFRATDPESFWDRLAHMRIDFLHKVKDPELRKEFEAKILGTKQRVYKQFIPFIESRIHIFGWQNSPLEEYTPRHKLNSEEVISYFEQARSILKQFKISEEEQIDFLSEIDRLEEKLERYQSEPTLFTFERLEEELQKELVNLELQAYDIRSKEILNALDDEGTQRKSRLKFDLLLAKARSLTEIANRMLHESIRTRYEARGKDLFEHVEYLKAISEAPKQLLATEAELKDLFQRIKGGEKVDVEKLDEMGRRLSEMKGKKFGIEYRKIVERLEKLFARTQRILAGETVDEDDDRFRAEGIAIDWAWILLGVERGASQAVVRRAYHTLALKYHPDISKKGDAAEKMKRINEAFELIRRVEGCK